MLTLAFISQKGGAGKTTLACATAVAAERAGLTTVLVDLDPQASASKWSDLRKAETPVITSAQAARLGPILEAARGTGAELVVIDTAPHAADAALEAARAAQLVLIPCRASAADLTAIRATIDLACIAERRAIAILNAAPIPEPALGPGASRNRGLRHRDGSRRDPPADRPCARVDQWAHRPGVRPEKQSRGRERRSFPMAQKGTLTDGKT